MRVKNDSEERIVELFNKLVPIGGEVIVTMDNGSKIRTKTRSQAWVLDKDSKKPYSVILLEDISGYYLLSRVKPA